VEALRQVFFGYARSRAGKRKIGALHFGQLYATERALVIAVGCNAGAAGLVHGSGGIAAAAFGYPTAVVAHQGRGKAAR